MADESDNMLGVIAVEPDEDHLILDSEGGIRAHYNVILTKEKVGRIRAGYDCAKCFERHEEAWPKNCRGCGFPMSDRQAEFVAKEYRGEIRVGSTDTEDQQMAAIEEARWNEKQKQDLHVSHPHIVVPKLW